MDYMDADVAYLLGLIVARGSLTTSEQVRQLTIEFPYSSLRLHGETSEFDQETEISLGLHNIRSRLVNLLEADVDVVHRSNSVDLVVRFLRNNMMWRNLLLLLEEKIAYPHFRVPQVFLDNSQPKEWKIQFVRGFADVAGNIRHANRYVDGRHRVRLDVLNYPTNWEVPIQLCALLQQQIGVPVQLITWGHPNMGRAFREHQLNIFAEPFLQIGFSFRHKQKVLEELAQKDRETFPNACYRPCPAVRRIRRRKNKDDAEKDERLDVRLRGKHFDAYFQICRELGCQQLREGDTEAQRFTDEVEANPHDD
jgi:hypothetical protein